MGPTHHRGGRRWSGSLVSGPDCFKDLVVLCAITRANYHGAGQATTIKGSVKIGGEVGYDLPDGLSLLGLLTANCQD